MKNTSNLYAPYDGTCLDDTFVGINRAKQYISNWDGWAECFSPKTLLWLVENRIKMKDACSIKYIPCNSQSNAYYEKNYERLPKVKENFMFKERRGEWTRDQIEDAYQYVIPSQFQSIELKEFFYDAIYRDYPYLRGYKFDAYVPTYSTKTHDIYIKFVYEFDGVDTTHSLYCPLEALKAKDPKMIYNRHYSYNSEYYANRINMRNSVLAVLNSEAYKEFCEKVKGN